ncbi:serpin B12 [Pelobates cultripes]|uniref:Serpin B12 n=1 Tax=Pelobates cultripes TaxID=61616 RepID=A0AAD1RYR6_PELCU|nr:serpin B12 [Pelobates cultripes]
MASVNKSINTFSLNLYKELSSSNNEKSVFCSPISVASVLSMLNLGARGDTQRQIKKVLEFGEFTEARVKPPNRCENPAQGIQQTQRVQKQTVISL